MREEVNETAKTSELYRSFVEFVRLDIENERRVTNRRMFNVFFWCFLLPVLAALSLLALIKFGILPRSTHRFIDWIIVGFPVAFSTYVLSVDVLKDMPRAFRRGGMSGILEHALEDAKWRDRVCAELSRRFLTDDPVKGRAEAHRHWPWLIEAFEIDLENLRHRMRHLTVLAGAVFFLLFLGLDMLDEPVIRTFSANSILGWFQTSTSNVAQFVGLGLFLALLYLTGNQSYHSLARYLQCAKLVEKKYPFDGE